MVSTSCSDAQRPLGRLLATHIFEAQARLRVVGQLCLSGERDLGAALEMFDQLGQIPCSPHSERVLLGGFAGVFRSDEDVAQASVRCPQHQGKDARYRPQLTAQRDLRDAQGVFDCRGRDPSDCPQDADGNCQVETGPGFPQMGRREVHGERVFVEADPQL